MRYEISEVGKEMLRYQEELAEKHKYKPIPINLFTGNVRDKYEENLPEWCKDEKSKEVSFYSASGTKICNGYNRVVIGDYGAFIEVKPEQMCLDNICCKKGQEYRIKDERYANRVKYHWLTTMDFSDCKIYYQQKEVSYADYKAGMYYISPYEMFAYEYEKQNKYKVSEERELDL